MRQCFVQSRTFCQLVRQVNGNQLRVVLRLKMMPTTFILTLHPVIVRQLTIVNHRDVGKRIRPEGVSVAEVDLALSSHTHVSDTVSPRYIADPVTPVHHHRGADVLNDLGPLTNAVQHNPRCLQQSLRKPGDVALIIRRYPQI